MTIVGVIGSPVAHSLSPLLHTSAFAALGLAERWRSFAFEVAPGQASGALEACARPASGGCRSPCRTRRTSRVLVDECSDMARRLDAVNCVSNRDGARYGTNTDGEGFLASLARGAGFEPAGAAAWSIGAGGAARAVILALAEAGADRGGRREPHARAGVPSGRPGRAGRSRP